jgi:hypothetical protein
MVVIAAGCPDSGWEIVTPILQRSGLDLAEASVNLWLDEYFQASGIDDFAQISQPLQPEPRLGGDIAALLSIDSSSSVLVADSRNIWLLDFWATQFPHAKFLLVFNRAEAALAHALQQDVEPQRFLEQWQTVNRQLLNFFRRHRQRTLLLDAEAICLHPQALEAVCRRVGLTLKSVANVSGPATQPSAVERLLAAHFLAAHTAAQMLQMELEASSQPLGEMKPEMELQPVEAINSFRQDQARQRKLLLQLQQVQEELDTVTRLNQENERAQRQQSAAQQELRVQLGEVHQTLKKLETSHRERIRENELLLLQLNQVQEELDAATRLNQQNEQALTRHTVAERELKIQLEQALLSLQKEKTTHREATQDNELRLSQLRQLQEELNAATRLNQQNEQIGKQLAVVKQELETQLGHVHQNLQKLETSQRETCREKEFLLLQLQQVQKEQGHYFLKWQELAEEKQRGLPVNNGAIDKLHGNDRAAITSPLNQAIQVVSGLANKHKARKKVQKQVNLLKGSGLFDEAWYLATYKDVAGSGIDPVKHYLVHGAAEGRNPSPAFNTRAYLAANPDIIVAGMNPLVHFVKFGRSEGRLLQKTGPVSAWR